MLASRQSRSERRGIVLVLVLAMLALMAVIGITFATYSAAAKAGARGYALSVLQPQADELFDFALGQLVGDTADSRSVIRGHSLARDMYGNDAMFNGYVTINPQTGAPFAIQNVTAVAGSNLFDVTTNILTGDPRLYGMNFTRWIMRVTYTGVTPTYGNQPVDSTLEIVIDNNTSGPYRIFRVSPIDNPLAGTPVDNPAGNAFNTLTALYNPTLGTTSNLAMNVLVGNAPAPSIPASTNNFSFSLDGRYLRAFNGTGMSAAGINPTHGNFRYNGVSPHFVAMDEDYDACDLENWYLALQSADGQVMIPSFHRPAAIRYDPTGIGGTKINDWEPLTYNNGTFVFNQDSASRILRPVRNMGHDAATFPDLFPDPKNGGKISYDVDNDGDGVTDSVWLDLGYPARKDSKGQLYKPLFAFMVIGLNGRLPLNTAGNLANTPAEVGLDANGNPIFRGGAAPITIGAAGATLTPGGDGGAAHAVHLGNSVSEIDIAYALQNGFNSSATSTDPTLAFTAPPSSATLMGQIQLGGFSAAVNAFNSQIDSGGIDVRLTQARNLLAGTRPQPPAQQSPGLNNWQNYPTGPLGDPAGATNGDDDVVFYTPPGSSGQQPFFMPNGMLNSIDTATGTTGTDVPFGTDPGTGLPYVIRNTPPVGGRWGEASAIPGVRFTNPATPLPPGAPQYFGVVGAFYSDNAPRAGYSLDPTDILLGSARDAADDNYNSFDPFPGPSALVPGGHTGEAGDVDFYDNSGALLLPVDRMRRWLTPADINGTGSVGQWTYGPGAPPRGFDAYGRVEYTSYFRPPGAAGAVSFNPGGTFPVGYRWGAVQVTYNFPNGATYWPDQTSNPTHGFESFRFPGQAYAGAGGAAAGFTPQRLGGMPIDVAANVDTLGVVPTAYPTYDFQVNAKFRSDGLNEADEMNLYNYAPLLDSPYGPSDLEWLYRQQDVDGSSLTSRLKQLAPISFTNAIDGQRRRRLFALDTWESNGFVWANDNPTFPGTANPAFPTNSRFGVGQSASLRSLGVNTPALAQRDRKINLNYPLPVSNDPNEPIRQKWISDTYQLLKLVLPPKAVDTPEELVQLSQYVINIIDFRDPDSTMTHWVNPDVAISVLPNTVTPSYLTPPAALSYLNPVTGIPPGYVQLDQYGMEFNPVAINEALAYTYNYQPTGGLGTAYRFMIELVNTLTQPQPQTTAAGIVPNTAANLDLSGFQYTQGNPYSGGCWDIVFTGDDPYSRPDPYRGELPRFGNIYGLTPLTKDSFMGQTAGVTIGSDVILQPLLPNGGPAGANRSSIPPPQAAAAGSGLPPSNYFYVIGNMPPTGTPAGGASMTYEAGPLQYGMVYNGNVYPNPNGTTVMNTSNVNALNTAYTFYSVPPVVGATGVSPSPVMQSLNPAFDPMTPKAAATLPFPLYPGVLPGILGTDPTGDNQVTAPPLNYKLTVPPPVATAAGQRGTSFIWVCLRRPANLFAPVSAYNPMLVVDAMRVPYVDGTGSVTQNPTITVNGQMAAVQAVNTNFNTIYSAQRFQPYRGGHAVPQWTSTVATPTMIYQPLGSATATAATAIDTRYGFSEQIVPPTANSLLYVQPTTGVATAASLTQGIYSSQQIGGATVNIAATFPVYHTLGLANEWEVGSTNIGLYGGNALVEGWDHVPFNDRDFTSVAELMLVPASAPGLFTKQFVEFAPSQQNLYTFFAGFYPSTVPSPPAPAPPNPTTSTWIGAPTATSTYYLAPSLPTSTGFAAQYQPGVFITAQGANTAITTGSVFAQSYTTQQYLTLFPNPTPALTAPAGGAYAPAPGMLYSPPVPVTGTPLATPPTPGTVANFVNVASASVPLVFAGTTTGAAGATTPASPALLWYPVTPAGAVAAVPTAPTLPNPVQPQVYPYLSDKFFYTGYGNATTADGGGLVGGYASDGWFKMFEFFEVPTQAFGAIGPVASGSNFDWSRQDTKPGLLNINLIIDEEVYLGLLGKQTINQNNGQLFAPQNTGTPAAPMWGMAAQYPFDQFTQQQLNMNQIPGLTAANYSPTSATNPLPLPAGSNPIPMIVTSTLSNGSPGSAYPLASAGLLAADPVTNAIRGSVTWNTGLGTLPPLFSNNLKASFVQFLWLRHGGSGYMFGWGNGAVGQNMAFAGADGLTTLNGGFGIPAEAPFRSLSFPDIDQTVMRPAAMPPTTNTSPAPAALTVDPIKGGVTQYYAADPGVRSPNTYITYSPTAIPAGYQASTINQAYSSSSVVSSFPGLVANTGVAPPTYTYYPSLPPPVPARRLFQFSDSYVGNVTATTPATAPFSNAAPSNASQTGDPFINNTTQAAATPPLPVIGAIPPTVSGTAAAALTTVVNNGMVNLMWPGPNAAIVYDTIGAAAYTVAAPANPSLGATGGGAAGAGTSDNDQHPYWRSEEMQRVMNLTTVRTHQYAVWITVGFFQVKRQGDIGMASVGALYLAYDVLGAEKGALDGTNKRFRAFFLVDRLRLPGFDPANAGQFQQAIVYRNRIE
jgi:hypothetical protein